jgi:hypothetical protein
MLNSEKLILVELHKSGSSRLRKFLAEVVGGEPSGKLAVFSDELVSQGKPVVGLVCDPLSWYLDQWQAGCAGKGELHKRLTDEKRWDLMRSRRTNRPAKVKEGGKVKVDPKAIPETWGAEYAKTYWYADANNAEAFREWLQAVAASRGIRNLIDRGYQVSPVSNLGGLMTYHYFIKFVRNGENMERSVETLDALRALNTSQAITTHFIRAESAGEDLLKVLDALGVSLTDEQRSTAQGFKRKGSESKAIRTFYDKASRRLVAEREQLMNEFFGYGEGSAPGSAEGGTKKAGKAGKKKEAGESPGATKLTKEEREQKRLARTERRAAKEASGEKAESKPKSAAKAAKKPAKKAGADPSDPAAAGSEGSVPAAGRPTKVKRVKNRPADEEVIENDE